MTRAAIRVLLRRGRQRPSCVVVTGGEARLRAMQQQDENKKDNGRSQSRAVHEATLTRWPVAHKGTEGCSSRRAGS
jgi:hypothetical protein